LIIEIEVFVHETEDLSKVIERFKRIFPFEDLLTKEKLKGAYHTSILFVKGHVEKEKDVASVINLLSKIDGIGQLKPLEKRIEKNTLFVRINKQTMKYEDVDDCFLVKLKDKNVLEIVRTKMFKNL
jgi:RNA binding exosome subunit